MQHKKYAFTLVELIVVISILAILGTIAFVSLQWYSAEARNAKRQSDLTNIVKNISLKRVEWVDLSAFLSDSTSSLSGTTKIRISGHEWAVALDGKYAAGNINYTVLGVKQEDFLDPTFNVGYKMWYTDYGKRFEVAATIEDDAEYDTLVKGTWSPRNSSDHNYDLAVPSDTYSDRVTLSWVTVQETWFIKWDLVRFNSGATTYEIKKLKWDTIYVTPSIVDVWSSVFLHGDETRSLIKRWDSDNAIDTGKWYKYTPYYQ